MSAMPIRFAPLLALALALAGPVQPGSALAESRDNGLVTVFVDNAKIIRLPEKTQTVVVGNPLIADVTLQKNGVLVLTGKSFGMTNLIALDATGTMLAESTVRVDPAQNAVVTVQRGPDERNSYSCTPTCQPAMQLGDSSKYFADVSGQADARRKLATGSTTDQPMR